jgi:penicillin-binding protein 1A
MSSMARSRQSRPPARRGWFAQTLRYGLYATLLGLIILSVTVATVWSSLPGYSEMRQSPNGQMVRVRAVDGTVIVAMGPVYGEWIEYRSIPKSMVDAMVSVEDRRFRNHPGIDPIGIARSVMVRVQEGRWKQGGSTITQQLARNIFLNNNKNFGRKAREIVYALALEAKFSKDQILELYLNRVYFGGGAYGIDAASRKFFGHPAKSLDLAESAIIAGLVKAPSSYSPTADAKAAIGRAGVVLESMTKAGVLTPMEAARVRPQDVKLAPEAKQNSVRYFTDWALPELDTLIEETDEPIDVWTTLDLKMQSAADAAIRANVPGGAQGALVAMDRDGAVRAMVGGTDYVTSIYNRSTQAVRQPGSAFKLFVYLAALEAGFTVNSKVVDEPVEIGGWSPKNSSGRFSGEIDLRTAFAYSINTVAAKLGSEVGTSAIADMARRFGISTPLNTHPSMVLGTADVRLLDMTRAYAGVAAKGTALSPYGIVKVTTDKGRVLYTHRADLSKQVVAPHVSGQMIDLLQTAVNTGTGKAAAIGRPAAGKTGTTSSNKDGWFMGFSSGLTTGVWMGRDDARPVRDLQGGRAPAKAWSAFMRVAVAGRKVEPFDTNVKLPEWQLETDEEAYFGDPDNGAFVDKGGDPLPAPEGDPDPQGGDSGPQTMEELLEEQAPN